MSTRAKIASRDRCWSLRTLGGLLLLPFFLGFLAGDSSAQGTAPSGTLSQAVNFAPGGSPEGVAVAKLRTGSAISDAVIVNYATDQVGVLLGNGNGTFQPMVTYSAGGSGVDAVAVADVNGDGIPDIIVATQGGWSNGDGTVGVLLGNGDGTFKAVVSYDSGGTNPNSVTNATLIGSVVVADMNKDGKPDIVVSNQAGFSNGDGTVGILLGNGDGTFQTVTAYDSGGVGTDGLAVGDLLGLGYPDVVVANYCGAACGSQSGSISVLLNVIATPGTLSPAGTYTTGGPTSSVAVGDLDGNGTIDVLVGLETYGTQIFLNTNGDGLLSAGAPTGAVGQVDTVAIQDLNGDSQNDIVVGLGYCNICDNAIDTGVAVALNNGNGTFQPFVTYDAAGVLVTGLAFGDLNGDGTPDLAAVSGCDTFDSSCGGNLAVFLNNPSLAVTSALSASTPAVQGSPVTLTDTVNNPGNLSLGAGSVTFYDGTTSLATLSVPAFIGSQSFTFSWTPATQGTHWLAAVYSASGVTGIAPESSTSFLAVSVGAAATVLVPNVVGDTQVTAAAAITGASLVLGTVTQESSTTVASGLVISESPAAGTSAAVGSAVNLVVSSGPPPVTVPNVVGLTQAAATTSITAVGLTVGTVTQQSSSTVAAGSVISESPAAGASVNAGSAVNLVVSTGPATVTVPNVVGDTQAAATTALTSAGLTLGTVTLVSSTTPAGVVISQTPVANASVPPATSVNLVVSSGPAPVSILVNETVTVTDSEDFPDVFDAEGVHVTDQVFVTPLISVAGPVAYYSVQSLGFGGASGSQVVTLSNIGEAPMTIESVGTPTNAAFAVTQVSCSDGSNSLPETLPPGGTCSFIVGYSAPAGGASGSIAFTDSSGLSNLPSAPAGSFFSQTLPLNGSGTSTPGGAAPRATVTVPTITETIHVVDAPTVTDVHDAEAIHVVDSIKVITLRSITVAPVNPTIVQGTAESFTATGAFSDGSTQNLTSAVTWTSSNTTVATLSGATARGVGAGSTTITATLGSIHGSTTLTVQAPLIRISAQFKSITQAPVLTGPYTVTLSVVNTGNISATKVTVLLAALGTTLSQSSTTVANLAPGATGTITITFPVTAGKPGAKGIALGVLGDATGTNPNGTAAIPAPWAVARLGIILP